jgi:hypothetical protein
VNNDRRNAGNHWQAAHGEFVSRRLRTEASQLAAKHLTGDQLLAARQFLRREGRTASDIHQFMIRLNNREQGPPS